MFQNSDSGHEWCGDYPACCPSSPSARQSPVNVASSESKFDPNLVLNGLKFSQGYAQDINGYVVDNGHTGNNKLNNQAQTYQLGNTSSRTTTEVKQH